jgi:5'-nucleotidase
MHILLTNDDGVFAPGLLALAQSLQQIGDVTVIAPDRNWSASGHVKTMHRPLRVTETALRDGTPALSTDGAPSDCVALALLGLVQDKIDIVVSGINPLPNVGHDVTYSGTVTAAMEATLSGLPGVAVSLDSNRTHSKPLDYGPAAKVAAEIVKQIHAAGLPNRTLLNINVPYVQLAEIGGVAITRQGQRVYRDALVEREDPRGRKYYWIGGDIPTGVAEQGTDFWALAEQMVSVTPLMMNLTAADFLPVLEELNLQLDRES